MNAKRCDFGHGGMVGAGVVLAAGLLFAAPAAAAELKVMKQGLGTGTVEAPGDISCGATCSKTYSTITTVTLTATADADSTFDHWEGDCSGSVTTCSVTTGADRSVRAVFRLTAPITPLTSADLEPTALNTYLATHGEVNSGARFLDALPVEFKRGWILMSRSESLQTGTAQSPRILLPSVDAKQVFSFALSAHASYPGASPKAIEYMRYEASDKNFHFHEIVLDTIPAVHDSRDATIVTIRLRHRGVSLDDDKCFRCHSTRNVLNRTGGDGTTGFPAGSVVWKNKPNWDTYDSWGAMLPFNRDHIYQGSVEAAAIRKFFNPWTWQSNPEVGSLIEQLELQPPPVPAADLITRVNGGTNDGHVNFAFDAAPPVLTEPSPGTATSLAINYEFDAKVGTGAGASIARDGAFVTLHAAGTPSSGEGRGVQLFDLLGGADGTPNQDRIADEINTHRFATGNVPIDVRPVALAITNDCLVRNATTNSVDRTGLGSTALAIDLNFFTHRNGMHSINDIYNDTLAREHTLPRRKADLEKFNLDRTADPYLRTPGENGLILEYGATTSQGTATSLDRIRQEVFRRSPGSLADASEIGGFYVDREQYADGHPAKVALYRYFLEPLGVSVDKWSLAVRGRSRTYTFADVFYNYNGPIAAAIQQDLIDHPLPGLTAFDCNSLIGAVNATLGTLPAYEAVPTYTDVQRVFNKSCIECHGGLDYPPFAVHFDSQYLDFTEDETVGISDRLARAYGYAFAFTSSALTSSTLYRRITDNYGSTRGESCPYGIMPCAGPALAQADIDTIRRWIVGGRPNTAGDPHLKTIDGTNYDFQAAGEFILLRGPGIEVQVRQTPVDTDGPALANEYTGLSSCVSLNTAAAVRVGPHRITYQPGLGSKGNPEGLELRVDGKLVHMTDAAIVLASGGRIIRTSEPGGIKIEFPGGTSVIITPGWWDYRQLWYMNIDIDHARATEGVIGAIAPRNWLPALADGSLLGPRPSDPQQRYRQLYVTFAESWRVTNAGSLFDYAPGTSTRAYTLASWPGEAVRSCRMASFTEGPPEKPPLKALAVEAAKQHCQAIVAPDRRRNCEADVMITGDLGFAKTYLATERVERNKPPATPVLLFPARDQIDLPTNLTFKWQKSVDADRDGLTYLHCVWRMDQKPNFNQCKTMPAEEMFGLGHAWLLLLIPVVLLLLIVLLSRLMRKHPAQLVLLVAAILLAVLLVFRFGRSTTLSQQATQLHAGTDYSWKVIAQDGKGGTTESETRRFATK